MLSRVPRSTAAVRLLLIAAICATPLGAGASAGAATAAGGAHGTSRPYGTSGPGVDAPSTWQWPTHPAHIVVGFVAPAHEYGPGHRGIDLEAPIGSEVRSPAPGVIAFAGQVAGRGILTIDHGDALVTTLEPVHTALTVGTYVDAGEVVGLVGEGGHARPGTLHFGVRDHGEYVNPMVLLGGVDRAVLLPCC